MERLTRKDLRKACNDPWDCCGLDNVCKRDCFKPEPCKIPKMIDRLAAYEDTGLEPEDIISAVDMAKIACALHELNAYKDVGKIEHLRELVQAEQEGRLVVLPCKVGIRYMSLASAV